MALSKILLQLDPDSQTSTFDSVVAVDSGVDQLFRHANVLPEEVRNLIYGLIFTRGVPDLKSSAVFVGGSNVAAGEQLLKEVVNTFFGPMRVSVLFDANGANTTAAAAVLAAMRHTNLQDAEAVVLAGTGPVGQRAALLLARQGARVRVASRTLEKATSVCQTLEQRLEQGKFQPVVTKDENSTSAAIEGAAIVIAAGAAGIQLASEAQLQDCSSLKVAIDLNAVPPVGLAGIQPQDKAVEINGVLRYGALGVGGTKMKIHKEAVQQLFQQNDQVLDAEQIFDLGLALENN
ncbi:MAG: methylene-tetrahydromethanopterin dehydrogenase N-terminal domain-containing protein [Pirellulales bacterium]